MTNSTKGKEFFDTNVLIYAFDSSDVVKQQIAIHLIADSAASGRGTLSTQVLGEFFHATVIRRRLLSAVEATSAVGAFQSAFPVASIDQQLVTDAIAIHQRYQLRYWDSLIVATAISCNCAEVLSEDLGHGQVYNGVIVRNPFRV